ncbi:ArgS-related anticodon-binding protein NrtL [Streptomyces sp. TP-A0874]|uniref:ArgS-related anticodon-binding protein NrtL n=1 Tax=Streptomyces sp. TP-A0874 TaxID=549819 RepID=UPI0008538940|nr:DALR anticodon-binding domain-containing protein [Streptomyces sp. TP-A0874]
MTPAQLSSAVLRTVSRAIEAGELVAPAPERVRVAPPPHRDRGDYATGVALQLARNAGQHPRAVAELLRARLARLPGIATVEVAEPGFLNITLDRRAHASALISEILTAADQSAPAVTAPASGAAGASSPYGHGDELRGEVVELTAPAETRALVTAEALSRILRAQGATVIASPAGQGRESNREDAGRSGVADASASTTGSGPEAEERAAERFRVRVTPVVGSFDELSARFGADATRWALLRPAAHDRPRLTEELLVQRESNPFFRVRYAHARACSLLRNAVDLGVCSVPGKTGAGKTVPGETVAGDQRGAATYEHPSATALLGALGEYPDTLRAAARHRAPDRVARQLERIAGAFFRFHDGCDLLPRGERKPEAAHRDRIALARAAGTVLAGGLHLLGIHAPQHL